MKLQLPRDNPIRQAIDLGRDRHIGRPYDPLHPFDRTRSLIALFHSAYPGMPIEVWNLARRLDDGSIAEEARRQIRLRITEMVRKANHK